MRSFHFYDEATGLLNGASFAINAPDGHEETARRNAPPGHRPIEGVTDHLSQRVDLATGKLVDYQPPQPSADHEWHADTKRWHLTDAAAQRAASREAAQAQIGDLERQSISPMRALLLNPQDAAARTALTAIDAQIAALRAQI